MSGLLLVAPLTFAFIAALLMIDRDITAPSWIKNAISDRAAEILGGGELEFGNITMRIGRDLHPRVQLEQTILRDGASRPIAQVDEISGLMSPRGLLFKQAALMQEVVLRGTAIDLERAPDGTIAAQFSGADLAETAPSLVALLDQMDAVFERPALEALEQIRLEDVTLTFNDARAGQAWRVEDGDISLDLRGGLLRFGAILALADDRGGDVPNLSILFESPRGSRAADVRVVLADVQARDIATQSPALAWLTALDAALSAELVTTLDEAGQIAPMALSLSLGAGSIAGATPLHFDRIAAEMLYEPQAALITFEEVIVDSEFGRIDAVGEAFAPAGQDGLPDVLTAQLQFPALDLEAPKFFPDGVPLSSASVDLRLHLSPLRVDLGQAVVMAADTQIVLDGHMEASPSGWGLALNAQADTLSRDALLGLWPQGVKPRTNAWIEKNVQGVEMANVAFGWRADPGGRLRMAGSTDFEDAEIKFLSQQPPVIEAAGFVTFDADRFSIALEDGIVRAPEGGVMDMAGSTFTMPDLSLNPPEMQLSLRVDSSLTAAMSVMDQPPFSFVSKSGLPVALAEARAVTTGEFSFPGDFPITADQVTFSAQSELTRVRSERLMPGRVLTAERLAISLDRARMQVSGLAQLDGVPMQGVFEQGFLPDTKDRGRLEAQITLSEGFLDAFNIGLPPGSVGGRGTGQLEVDLVRGSTPRFSLGSDLRGITLALPPVGWSKPPGTAGELSITGQLGPVPRIDGLRIAGGGLDARGQVALRDDGSLDRASFDRLQVGDWLNAPIVLRGRGAGQPVGVEINGGLVDLRRARFGPREGESGPLEIALDRLQISDGISLQDFRGSFQGQGGFNGQFSGRVNGEAAIRGTVVPQSGRSAVRLVSDDAGGVARAAGVIRNAVGGSLEVTLAPVGEAGTFDGLLRVRGLRLRDAPAVAALLDAVSVVGLLQQLDGQGLAFDEVDARFRLTPRQVILAQSSAVGPGLGISLDGIYTLATKEMDFQGVISPFFIVNQIGSVLTRRGEGLIGFNFNVAGPVSAPRVSVNPLSVLTPGMFREIFRRPPPELDE